MVSPVVKTRVEKRDFLVSFAVEGCLLVRLAPVAVEAGQGEILEHVFAALGQRHDVVNREADVLPALVGVTILAEGASAPPDSLPQVGGYLARHQPSSFWASARLRIRRLR